MAKGAIITDEVKQLITRVFLEQPGLKSKEIQNIVSHRLSKNGDWPSLSVVEKLLVDIRKRYYESLVVANSQDAPWGIGTIEKYPISPEALPDIMKAVWWGIEHFEEWEFTIRQAKWAGRLYGFETLKQPGCLFLASYWYAHYEKVCELSKSVFETRWFDDALEDFQTLQKVAHSYDRGVPEKIFEIGIEKLPLSVPHVDHIISVK